MYKLRSSQVNLMLMQKQYQNVLNEDNIKDFNIFKLKKVLKNESSTDRDAFAHYLFTRWVKGLEKTSLMEDMTLIYRVLWKNRIKLKDYDKHELALLEERAFSKIRHIKGLEVDVNLRQKEAVGAKFTQAELYKKDDKLVYLTEADLLISNKRIFLDNKKESFSTFFEWPKIIYYKFTNYGFEFGIDNDVYVIRIHDQETLNNTMKNFISKKVKNAIKKCQNI